MAPSTHSYSYDRLNGNTDSGTTIVLPPYFDTSIQTQLNSALDASVGTNYLASPVLDQSTNHHVNTGGNDNDYSQSYETPWKTCRSYSFGDTISTTTTPRSSTLHSPGK